MGALLQFRPATSERAVIRTEVSLVSLKIGVPVLAALFALGLLAVPTAQAAVVTVGSPLQGPFEPGSCGKPCTVVPIGFPITAPLVSSPIDGTVIRWRIQEATPGASYRSRVVSRSGEETAVTTTASSAIVSPAGAGLETFTTQMPIKAGQLIGLDLLNPGAKIGFADENGGSYLFFVPPPPDGLSHNGQLFDGGGEVAFSVDVQPPPTVTSLTPVSGSFKGGATVTIAGTDLEGASAVSFGSTPARSFRVSSETEVTAVAPPLAALSRVPVTVTTPAGAATSTATYTGVACVVPDLEAERLRAVRRQLKRSRCRLGKVKELAGATAETGTVVMQSPRAGRKLMPGARVRVEIEA